MHSFHHRNRCALNDRRRHSTFAVQLVQREHKSEIGRHKRTTCLDKVEGRGVTQAVLQARAACVGRTAVTQGLDEARGVNSSREQRRLEAEMLHHGAGHDDVIPCAFVDVGETILHKIRENNRGTATDALLAMDEHSFATADALVDELCCFGEESGDVFVAVIVDVEFEHLKCRAFLARVGDGTFLGDIDDATDVAGDELLSAVGVDL